MTRTSRQVLWFCALVATGLIPGSAVAVAQAPDAAPDPRLEKVTAAWRKLQAETESVRYRVAGKRVISKGAYTFRSGEPPRRDRPPRPPEDLTATIKMTLTLDLKG